MRYARLIVSARDDYWLAAVVREFTGDSSSVIACDAEIGVEQVLDNNKSPDGRPAVAFLVFAFSVEALGKAVTRRGGQCLMTCPTTAAFDGLRAAEPRIAFGKHLRFFGDGYQKSKVLDGSRFWRIPVMDGEFVIEATLGTAKGVAGGNFIVQGVDQETALIAARRAAEEIGQLAGVITPFPSGVVRSGSKVGSRYKALRASTFDAFCPTLRGRVATRLHPAAQCAYEIVIDGVDAKAGERAMAVGIRTAAGEGIVAISAGNYGGKLGKYHFHLQTLLQP